MESKPRSEEKSRKEMEKKRTDGPVREWDIGKKDMRRSRSRDRSRKHRRSPSPSEGICFFHRFFIKPKKKLDVLTE